MEPVTDAPTESLTERTARKITKLKQELFSLFLLVLGVISVIDPNAVALILGPEARGYTLIAVAISVYLLRVFTKTPAEKIFPERKK